MSLSKLGNETRNVLKYIWLTEYEFFFTDETNPNPKKKKTKKKKKKKKNKKKEKQEGWWANRKKGVPREMVNEWTFI